jgi:hypothetical protein
MHNGLRACQHEQAGRDNHHAAPHAPLLQAIRLRQRCLRHERVLLLLHIQLLHLRRLCRSIRSVLRSLRKRWRQRSFADRGAQGRTSCCSSCCCAGFNPLLLLDTE